MNAPASHQASSAASEAMEDASQGATTPTPDDSTLLRRYAEEGSEAAFAELVRRHVDLVFGAALRRTGGDSHRAADVAQQVFTALARNARKLSRHAVLGAWLHTATRNAALNLMISEQRRQARELQALALDPSVVAAGSDSEVDWNKVRPVLDAAIDELPESDRTAVVLRFLERKPFSEIGGILRMTEDAARMRTDRAIEKLRLALARRGIHSTAAALGASVLAQPAMSAPVGLAATLATGSFAPAAGIGAFATLATLMSTKIIATVAVSAVVFFSLGTYVGIDYMTSQPVPPPPEAPEQAQKIAALREQGNRLRAEVDRLTALNASLSAPPRPVPPPPAPTTVAVAPPSAFLVASQQRAILNNLRQIAAARDQFILENGRPPASIDELVGETKYIRRLVPVVGENYSALLMQQGQPLVVTAENGMTVTYDPAGGTTTQPAAPALSPEEQIARIVALVGPKVGATLERAVAAYRAANNDAMPRNPNAVLSYFGTPQEGADFIEALQAAAKKQ